MDVKNWYRSFSTRSTSVRLGKNYNHDDIEGVKESFSKSGGSKSSIWKVLWKKLSKEKKELRLEFSRSVHVRVPRYDEYTYSQNFDDGFINCDEPDCFVKSFSVRYADPSKLILLK
ncbi:hypothetical protein R3W88_032504 [Solanum pinnatisectum]|uniref:Uncharacterized protein n=1 Tax=Solanum pinnatisectum TaxID=50273 RepID=A0AAV9LT99_9SOLN|nr:hypothetical protein R3W88_032504 [Solanum pinnatisectum]